MTDMKTMNAETIVARFVAAANGKQSHSEDVIADCIEGIPVAEVENALTAAGLAFHRVPLKLHYRAPGEMPKLVLGVKP